MVHGPLQGYKLSLQSHMYIPFGMMWWGLCWPGWAPQSISIDAWRQASTHMSMHVPFLNKPQTYRTHVQSVDSAPNGRQSQSQDIERKYGIANPATMSHWVQIASHTNRKWQLAINWNLKSPNSRNCCQVAVKRRFSSASFRSFRILWSLSSAYSKRSSVQFFSSEPLGAPFRRRQG